MRQSGYRVTIRGFLPADRKSLADSGKAIDMLNRAMMDKGARAELLDALLTVRLEVVSTTRLIDEPAPAPTPEPEPFA